MIIIDQVGVLAIEIAGDRVNLIRIILFKLRQVLLGGIEVLIGRAKEQNHVAGIIAAERFLFDLRRACRCRIRVLPALLAHAFLELGSKTYEEGKDGTEDDDGNDLAVRIGKSSPFFKHVG